jgi:hypothetical protein
MREVSMKKQIIILFTLVAISLITFTGCEPFIENKITLRNYSEAKVKVLIRSQVYEIAARVNLNDPIPQIILNDFKKGTFEYETVYSLPSWASDGTIEGDFAGNMILNAGTEILLSYFGASSIDSLETKYTISASLTSSDDINRVDPFADGGTGSSTP